MSDTTLAETATRRTRTHTEGYGNFVTKLLKKVAPASSEGESQAGLNDPAKRALNLLALDLVDRITDVISRYLSISKSKTAKQSVAELAIDLLLKGDLRTLAVEDANKAVRKYKDDRGRSGVKMNKSMKAGIIFPTSRVAGQIRARIRRRVAETTPVFVAAAVESVLTEILTASVKLARDHGKVRVTPRNIFLAIKSDEELAPLFSRTLFAGGVLPRNYQQQADDDEDQ